MKKKSSETQETIVVCVLIYPLLPSVVQVKDRIVCSAAFIDIYLPLLPPSLLASESKKESQPPEGHRRG